MSDSCSQEKWKKEEDKIVEKMSKYEVSASSFIWINSTCPDCGTINWIDMLVEPEACECFKCKKTFWISEKIYNEHKTSLVMLNVFDSVNVRAEEFVFYGQKNPD